MAGKNSVAIEILAEIDKSVKSLAELQKQALANFDKIQKESAKAFEKSQKQASQSLEKIGKGFDTLKNVGQAALGFIAGRAIISAFDDVVAAASREQDAIQRLNSSLQLAGNYSKKASEGFVAFADELENTTVFSGEAILSAGSLIETMTRLDNEGLKKATEAAANLSAAFGKDLTTSSEIVGKALNGNVTGLKRLGINISDAGSKAEITARVFAKLSDFQGFAAKQADTFSGATTQLGNAFEEFQKTIGRIIVQNPELIAGLQIVAKTIREISAAFAKNDKPITNSINSLTEMAVKTIPKLLTPLGFLSTAIGNTIIIFNKFLSGVLTAQRGISILIGGALVALPNALFQVAEAATIASQATLKFFGQKDAASGLDKALEDIRKKFVTYKDINDEFNKSFGGLGSTLGEVQVQLLKTNTGIDEFNQGFVAAIEDARPAIDKAVDGFGNLVKKIDEGAPALKSVGKAFDDLGEESKAALEAVKGNFDKLKTQAEALTAEINKQTKSKSEQIQLELEGQIKIAANAAEELALENKLGDSAKDQISNFIKLVTLKAELAKGELSFGDLNLKEIFDGVKSGLTSAFSGVTEIFSSLTSGKISFGDIGGSIKEALASGGKSLVESIKQIKLSDVGNAIGTAISTGASVLQGVLGGGYLQKISDFIKGFGELPKAFVEILKNLDEVVGSIFDSLPDILNSVGELVPKLFDKITEALPKLVEGIIPVFQKLASSIAEKAPAFAAAILDAITSLVDALPGIIDTLVKALPKLLNAILQKIPALITSILKAIPQIIRSLAQAIPELVSVIANNIGPIILALVQGILEAIPEIILVLIDEFIVKGGIFKIIGALIAAIPDIVIALVQGIVRAAFNSTGELIKFIGSALGGIFSNAIKLPSFDLGEAKDILSGKKLIDGIRDNFATIKDVLTGKRFAETIKAVFDKFQNQLKDILSGGLAGGKSGKAAGAFSKLGFAEGGQAFKVPSGFNNDTFPANLTSGELIVDASTASKLRDFLNQDGSATQVGYTQQQPADLEKLFARLIAAVEDRQVNVAVNLNEQQLATAVYNAKRRGFRI